MGDWQDGFNSFMKRKSFPIEGDVVGRLGEEMAAQYLKKKGYQIVAQNQRSGPAEIDLIALTGDILCFIEVKSRRTDLQGTPEEFVDFRKQKKMVQGAECFHARRQFCEYRIRFDVISVLEKDGKIEISHLQNAFEVDP